MDTQRMLQEVESEIAKLERVADVLRGMTADNGTPHGKHSGISAAARKKMSLAQKARWAKIAVANTEVIAKPKAGGGRKLKVKK